MFFELMKVKGFALKNPPKAPAQSLRPRMGTLTNAARMYFLFAVRANGVSDNAN